MATFDILKGYRDYGTFIEYVFEATSGYTPAEGDVVVVGSDGKIAKATSGTLPIATGVVWEATTPSATGLGKYAVLLGQGVIKTDNVATGADAPAVGDYVEVNAGVWKKSGGTNVPSGICLEASSGVYVIYKFI